MKKLTKLILPVFAFMFLAVVAVLPAKAEGLTVYISDNGTGDGSSETTPMGDLAGTTAEEKAANSALHRAQDLCIAAGGGTIVITDTYTISADNCDGTSNTAGYIHKHKAGWNYKANGATTITYTGGKLLFDQNCHLYFPTASEMKNITVGTTAAVDGSVHTTLSANCNTLTLGEGTNFENAAQFSILGGMRFLDGTAASYLAETTNIIVDIGNENEVGSIYGGSLRAGSKSHIGDTNITIKSGTVVGGVYADSKNAHQGYNACVTGNGTVTIEGGIFKGTLDFVDGGFTTTESTLDVIIKGGDFSAITAINTTDGALASGKSAAKTATLDLSALKYSVAEGLKAKAAATWTEVKMPAAPATVYIANEAKGTGDGSSPENAMGDTNEEGKSEGTALYKAQDKCVATGGGTIVIVGSYTLDNKNCSNGNLAIGGFGASAGANDSGATGAINMHQPTGPGWMYKDYADTVITYTGDDLILDETAGFYLPTASLFTDITVKRGENADTTKKAAMAAMGNTLTIGEDANIGENIAIFGLVRNNNGHGWVRMNDSTNIVIDAGAGVIDADIVGSGQMGGKTFEHSVNITVKSGTINGVIWMGGFTCVNEDNSLLTIEGGTLTGSIYGAAGGFNTADTHELSIVVKGGDLSDIKAIDVYDVEELAEGKNAAKAATLDVTALAAADIDKFYEAIDSRWTLKIPDGYTYTPGAGEEEEDEPFEPEMIIYVKDGGTGDGSSADKALGGAATPYDTGVNAHLNNPIGQAWEKIIAAGVKKAEIVICGPINVSNEDAYLIGTGNAYFVYKAGTVTYPDVTIKYTSVRDNVDYRSTADAAVTMTEKGHMAFPSATITENVIFKSGKSGSCFLGAGASKLYLGKGTVLTSGFAGAMGLTVLGGTAQNNTSTAVQGETNIIVDIGDEIEIGNIYGASNGSKPQAGTNITIKSGTVVGNIYGDGIITSQGHVNGDVKINIEGGVIKGAVYGLTVGGATANTNVTITVTGGDWSASKSIMADDGSFLGAAKPAKTTVLDLSGLDKDDPLVGTLSTFKALGMTEIKYPDGYQAGTPVVPTPPVNPNPGTGTGSGSTGGSSSSGSSSTTTTSPKTGEASYMVVVMALVAMMAAGVVLVKKNKVA